MQKIKKSVAWGVLLIVLLCAHAGVSQTPVDPTLELLRLSNESSVRFEQQSKRAKEYAQKNNVPLSFKDSNGNLVLLVDVSETGLPIYKTTDNAGAAITTGVTNLQSGGELGLNLEGEGMIVGIWDGGSVSHSEFADRILNTQGSEDDHPNHVTGTILAAGVNPSARGMAPKAQAYTFDFNNDEAEMLTLAKPDQSTLLLSNHSYGLITGWYFNSGWQWFGDPAISPNEDYKFGFYSGNAAFWDQIAFNAPYYSIIKSAGNERGSGNVGNGTRPPDCNGGSGYDCIGDVSTSKNIITVGAVSKVLTYTDANSVAMSSFSSWGPTDDGRIKPDLVAAGVNLFSTVTQNNYGLLSGTSMSAPNTTGSLLLLQELYKNLHAGNFMRAATLKALAIHTTKEAGMHPGPDYKFGWGLLDVYAGAKILLAEDGANVLVSEETLLQGQTFELTLTPKPNEKITATIVWTDPAGTPVSISLDPTNIMLVNDLDLRIADDADVEQFPWILDPSDPDAAASRGDNIRDNVEKIEFSNPEPRNYKLIVRHKGSLFGGSQNFSLILEYTSIEDPRTAYYWIGNSGNWNDPSHWSLTSGGVTSGTTPGSNDRVFIDENSFNVIDQEINISGNASCGSLTWLTNDPGAISLNDFTLEINGNLIVTSSEFAFSSDGIVELNGLSLEGNNVNLGGSDFSNANLVFQEGQWTIGGNGKVGSIELIEGSVLANALELELGALISTGSLGRTIDFTGTTITGLVESILTGTGLDFVSTNSVINLSELVPASIDWSDITFGGELISNDQLVEISGSSNYHKFHIDGEVQFNDDNGISILVVEPGSEIRINSGKTLELTENVVINSQADDKVTISVFNGGSASLAFDDYYKLCFDNLIVDGINIEGIAIINAGENSQITNTSDWLQVACDDVLFPKFSSEFSCVNSLIQFTDETSGIVNSWNWNFGDPGSSENTSTRQNPYHVYTQVGSYEVTLEVSNTTESRVYVAQIEIGENLMLPNHVVINFDDLFSFMAATGYRWYQDEDPIEGAVSRAYNFNGEPGLYFVLTIEGECNIKSSPVLITDLEENRIESEVHVFPNPVSSNHIMVSVPHELLYGSTTLMSSAGEIVFRNLIEETAYKIETQNLSNGLYILRIEKGLYTVVKKIVVQK